MSGAGVGVDVGGDAGLEQQDDVGPAELEVAELVALVHLGALYRAPVGTTGGLDVGSVAATWSVVAVGVERSVQGIGGGTGPGGRRRWCRCEVGLPVECPAAAVAGTSEAGFRGGR